MNDNKALQRRIKREIKAKPHTFFAVCQPGFEKEVMSELATIFNNRNSFEEQVTQIVPGGIEFSAKIEDIWKIHLKSFTITTIYWRVAHFRAGTTGEFASKIKEVPWDIYLPANATVEATSSFTKCRIPDGSLIARLAEREIKKQLSKNPPAKTEPLSINIKGEQNQFTLSLNCTGKAFYRRGYRKATYLAPLRETTAALILLAAKMKNYDQIFDPMCGSGVFGLEAAAMTCGLNPGSQRQMPFMQLPSFRQAAWNHLVKTEECQASPEIPRLKIYSSDIEPKAIEQAKQNFESLKDRCNCQPNEINYKLENFFSSDYKRIIKEDAKALFVFNPPYGKRIAKDQLIPFYKKCGKIINGPLKNCAVAIITPGEECEKALQLTADKKILFFNGGIKVALLIRY